MEPGFAIWITGLPASGKSTLTKALVRELSCRETAPEVLESDALRQILTPHPTYSEGEREILYGAMAYVGELLTKHGISVIFDATANRRVYRDRARQRITRFIEVFVECPLNICMARDPKGIYRKAEVGEATMIPGLQAAYEPPENPEVVVSGEWEDPARAARRVVEKLREQGYL
ncbi:MAG: adenylyl-sulfate kinase [Acidobacteria bacterium]|nr:adenylyl-sulfate kinase [Acidobacteriota bacterium]